MAVVEEKMTPDSSGKGNAGTPANVTLGVEGRFGKAAEFPGESGAEIVVADAPSLERGAGDFTIEAWVKPAAFSGEQAIASKWLVDLA